MFSRGLWGLGSADVAGLKEAIRDAAKLTKTGFFRDVEGRGFLRGLGRQGSFLRRSKIFFPGWSLRGSGGIEGHVRSLRISAAWMRTV